MTLEHGVKLSVISGKFRVDWEWIGEGVSGDYDPSDPDDEPLLRFTCYQEEIDSGFDTLIGCYEGWVQIDDSSYCTNMTYDVPIELLCTSAGIILSVLLHENPSSWKKRFEGLSHICAEDVVA